jgi:hypothetical protein
MATNRYISTSYWKDNYVADLDPSEKLLFIYMLTNPKTTIAGVYEINFREIAFDTGFDVDMVRKILDRFMADGKIIHSNGWVVLRNWVKHQAMNPSVSKGIDRTLKLLPDHLKEFVITSEQGIATSIDCDSLYRACVQGLPYSTLPNLTVLTKPNGTNAAETAELELGVEKVKPKKQRTIEIDGMYDYWATIVGYKITSKEKQNREYAGKLLNDYTKEEIAQGIHAAARASTDQFAPRIANFIDLHRKWDELKLWDKRQGVRAHATAEF